MLWWLQAGSQESPSPAGLGDSLQLFLAKEPVVLSSKYSEGSHGTSSGRGAPVPPDHKGVMIEITGSSKTVFNTSGFVPVLYCVPSGDKWRHQVKTGAAMSPWVTMGPADKWQLRQADWETVVLKCDPA